jgi:hypothetical protein
MEVLQTEEDLLADDGNMRFGKDSWFELAILVRILATD